LDDVFHFGSLFTYYYRFSKNTKHLPSSYPPAITSSRRHAGLLPLSSEAPAHHPHLLPVRHTLDQQAHAMNSLFCPTNPPPLASPPARWPFVSAAGRQAPCPNQQVAPPRPKNQNRKPLKLLCFARAPHAHLVSHLGRDPAPQRSFSPSPQPKRPESSASARAQNCEETVVAAHGPFRCHLSAGERVGDLGLHNSTRKASCLGNTTTGRGLIA
jgi:hypothetical protein